MKILKVFAKYQKAKYQMEKDATNIGLAIKKVSMLDLTITLKNGLIIYYKVLDSEHNLDKLRGYKVDCIFIDESKEINEREFFILNDRIKNAP